MAFLTDNLVVLIIIVILAGLYAGERFSDKQRGRFCAANRRESNKTLHVCNKHWAVLVDEMNERQIEREAAHAEELRERDAIIADLRAQLDRAKRIMAAPINR